MRSHTPGSWEAGHWTEHSNLPVHGLGCRTANGRIATVFVPQKVDRETGVVRVEADDVDEAEANVNLIAAAPELLAACEIASTSIGLFQEVFSETGIIPVDSEGLKMMKAELDKAIAKAKGELQL